MTNRARRTDISARKTVDRGNIKPEHIFSWMTELVKELQEEANVKNRDICREIDQICNVLESQEVYQFRNQNIERYCDFLYDTDQVCDFLHSLHAIGLEIGFCDVRVVIKTPANWRQVRTRVATTLPKKWIQEYIKCNLDNCDPGLPPYTASCAYKFFDHERSPNFNTNGAVSMTSFSRYWDSAAQFDQLRSGYALPVLTPSGDEVVVTLYSKEQDIKKRFSKLRSDALIAANLAAESFCDLVTVSKRSTSTPLTAGELSYLYQSLIEGLSSEGETESEPLFLRGTLPASIMQKLGVSNLTQAILHAFASGELFTAPYLLSEIQFQTGTTNPISEFLLSEGSSVHT